MHSESINFYNQLLESKTFFAQMKQIEFSTQPKAVVYREDKLVLYRYQAKVKKPHKTPLLIVFALINRPEILDLGPDCSFINSLLQAGRDIYLIDWGYPSVEDKKLTLDDYLLRYLKNCLQKIKQVSKEKQVDLLGVCQGGVFSLCYASLFPQDIRNLILISTPVDFQTPQDDLSRLAQGIEVDKIVDSCGNIPGAWLARLFSSLRPFQQIGKKYLSLLDYLSDEKTNQAWLQQFLWIEKWLSDTPDQAGAAFAQFIKFFYQENALLHNRLRLAGLSVDLKSLKMPILNLMARDDTIVPPQASRILRKLVQSVSYSAKLLPAGHIGIYVSKKTNRRLPKTIASWLKRMELRV